MQTLLQNSGLFACECVFIIILLEPSTEEAYPSGPPMTGKAGATGPDPSLEQLRSCGYCENGNAPHGSGSFLKFARNEGSELNSEHDM